MVAQGLVALGLEGQRLVAKPKGMAEKQVLAGLTLSPGLGLRFKLANVFELVQIAVERCHRKAAIRSRRRQVSVGKVDIWLGGFVMPRPVLMRARSRRRRREEPIQPRKQGLVPLSL